MLFFRRVVGGIIEHAVHRQAIVDIDRSLLAEYGAVHIKDRYAVCGFNVTPACFIRGILYKIHEFFQRCAVRIPGREDLCVINVSARIRVARIGAALRLI